MFHENYGAQVKYIYSKRNQKRKLKKVRKISGGLGILDIDTQLNSLKKMDSKVIKPNQCFRERSYAVLGELNT